MLQNTYIPAELHSLSWVKTRFILQNISFTKQHGEKKTYPWEIMEELIKGIASRNTTCLHCPHLTVFPSDATERENIVYHFPGRYFKQAVRRNEKIAVECVFFNRSLLFANQWMQCFSCKLYNFSLLQETISITEETLIDRLQQNKHLLSLNNNELVLNFLSPFYLNKERGDNNKHRFEYLSVEAFFSTLSHRIHNIFGISASIPFQGIAILPYYWQSDFVKRESGIDKHRKKLSAGSANVITHLVGGFTGPLYLKGDIIPVLPYILLGSIMHLIPDINHYANDFTRNFGVGYYAVETMLPFFDLKLTDKKNIAKSISNSIAKYHAVENFISMQQNKKIHNKLLQEIMGNHVYLHPNSLCQLKEEGRKTRWIEIIPPFELMLHYHLLKTLQPYIERMLDPEALGFVTGSKTSTATELIKEAVAQGYEFVLETDIEDFFPSIDHDLLVNKIENYFPANDTNTKCLLLRIIKTPYRYKNKIHQRTKGLPQGSPISPLLATFYLDSFDQEIKQYDVKLIRFADDLLIMTKSMEEASAMEKKLDMALEHLKIKKNIQKTQVKHISEGISFLGYEIDMEGATSITKIPCITYKKPLYLIESYVNLSLEGEALIVKKGKKNLASYPLRRISSITAMHRLSLSSTLIRRCVEMNIPLTLSEPPGYYITTIAPGFKNFFDTISAHAKAYFSMSEETKLSIAKRIVLSKIKNFIYIFQQRYTTSTSLNLKSLKKSLLSIENAETIHELLGHEGKSSTVIYEMLNQRIKYKEFCMIKRDRKSHDPLNVLLNFSSYLLFTNINAMLRQKGINPYLGFLHSADNQYESLVADLQEPFRPKIVQLILRLINRQQITLDDFQEHNNMLLLTLQAQTLIVKEFEGIMENKEPDNLRKIITEQCDGVKNWITKNKEIRFYFF